MYLNHPSNQASHHQQGSMLVVALFVIVVLAFLGLSITKLLSASSDSVVYEVLGQRALNAARSGIECSLANTFTNQEVSICRDGVTFDLQSIDGLENCQFTVERKNRLVTDGEQQKVYYQFTSVGQCVNGETVVSRTVYIDAIL